MTNWLRTLLTYAPPVLALIPGMPPMVVPAVLQIVADIETLKEPHTGAEKKALVLDAVINGMTTANTIAGKQVLDPVALTGVVSQGIDFAVGVANISKKVDVPVLPTA